MQYEHILDWILTDEEQAELPQPLRDARDAHIDAIRELETQHPVKDSVESIEQLRGMVIDRVIMDMVTRNLILK